jgi:hypothetical protein
MFHRQYPDTRISPTTINRLYTKHGVKYKYIRRVKKEIDFNLPHYREMLQDIQSEMRWAHHKGVKFISADEAVFTFHTFTKKSWSGSYNNITVLDRKITVKTHAILAGISEDKGLEHYLVCLKSIKTEEYIQFLERIAEMYPHQKIVLFIDNLIVHKTK